MKIKKLSASFGNLENRTLELKDGLNIIQAPNEAGKSTWCAFIRVMLYGLNPARDRALYMSDKSRFRPWGGGAMEGEMEISWRDRDITLRRTSTGKSPMKGFSAVYTGSGEKVTELTPQDAGEVLTGVSEDVFVRSAFLRQSGLEIGQTPDLEKRISALISAGDESLSYTEADARLRAWRRTRRHNRSGVIPSLEEKINGLDEKLSSIREYTVKIAEMREEEENLLKRREQLEKQLSAIAGTEARKASQKLREAQESAERARLSVKTREDRLKRGGKTVTRTQVRSLTGVVKLLESVEDMENRAGQKLEGARENSEKLTREAEKSPFHGQSTVSLRREMEERITRSKAGPKWTVIMILSLIAAFALGGLGIALKQTALTVIAPVLIICAAAIALKVKKRSGAALEFASLYGAESPEEFYGKLREYERLAEELKASSDELESARGAYDAAHEKLVSERRKFILNVQELDGSVNDVESAVLALKDMSRDLDEYEAGMERLRRAQEIEAALRAVGATEYTEAGEEPDMSRQEAETALRAVSEELDRVSKKLNITVGQQQAIGDPVTIGSEKSACSLKLYEAQRRYDAITMALDGLAQASGEMQTRFSPVLSRTAGEICRYITGDKYDRLTFDRQLTAEIKPSNMPAGRSILSMSGGTADQIYLSLRLAICSLILSGEEPCPVILDDALTNFDDIRLGRALDYLLEMSRQRQIILFTCHSREADYFAGKSGVTIKKAENF